MKSIFATLMILLKFTKCAIEPFIVGGSFTSVEQYPHSAFLTINCVLRDGNKIPWVCGASILNQRLLLTAGHCLNGCTESSDIMINIGSNNKDSGFATTAHSFVVHKNYNEKGTADIGMLKSTATLKFNSKISRVSISKKPPFSLVAQLAGWGLVNEVELECSPMLKSLNQRVWSNADCTQLLGYLPPGTLCAGSRASNDYAAPGDSGSALVVQNYIQIGLVSYKIPAISNSLIVYTNVTYYYDWIVKCAKKLYCV